MHRVNALEPPSRRMPPRAPDPSRLRAVHRAFLRAGRRGQGGRRLLGLVATWVLAVAPARIPPATAAAPAAPAPERIAADWDSATAALLRRTEAAGLAEFAAAVRDWDLPAEEGCQFVLAIPARLETPVWVDTAEERAAWDAFLDARRARAAGLFALAVEAARAHAVVPGRANIVPGRANIVPGRAALAPADAAAPPLAQRTSDAIRLLYRALRDDPDHARAREAGGWVRHDGRWVWPEAARRLEKGEEFSAEFGWLPRGRQDRYRSGERYEQGRWIKVDADAADAPRRGGVEPKGVKFVSDHWQITSAAGGAATAALAARLEETRDVWLQVFGCFQEEPAAWEQRFEGRGRRPAGPRGPFAATLTADREQYVRALEPLEPTIARTLGMYWTPTRTAWFFPDDGQEPTTVHHEATHQLFAETRRTSPLAGERCGFWAVEAAACYVESLEPAPFGWTVGGRDAGRAAVARERLLDDGFHVPLAELTALGRRALQADERLPQIYSEISGLADFFMNGERGRYREAFVEYLVRIYTGTVDADTLARLCGCDYADLDDAYRRHMAR